MEQHCFDREGPQGRRWREEDGIPVPFQLRVCAEGLRVRGDAEVVLAADGPEVSHVQLEARVGEDVGRPLARGAGGAVRAGREAAAGRVAGAADPGAGRLHARPSSALEFEPRKQQQSELLCVFSALFSLRLRGGRGLPCTLSRSWC